MSLSSPLPDLCTPPETDDRFAALDKLEALSEELRKHLTRRKSNTFALLAAKAFREGRIEAAGRAAMRAVDHDDTNVAALQLLARYLERMGYAHKALVTYERAYQLDPTDPDVILNLGVAAYELGEFETVVKMSVMYNTMCPNSPYGYINLVHALSSLDKHEEAINVLADAIRRIPGNAMLWCTLGVLLTDAGRTDESFVFFEEALRLSPTIGRIYHNMGYALHYAGRFQEGLDIFERALEVAVDPVEILEMDHSRGACLLGLGRIEEGFAVNEIRVNERFRNKVIHVVNAPYWKGEEATGKKILIMAEQGLGDEIMFANILPDVARAVGPDGKLFVAVDPRLVSLFQRSFPNAHIGPHDDRSLYDQNGRKDLRLASFATDENKPDYWALMATPHCWLRKRIEDFPHETFLTPDPVRVEDFRQRLEKGGPGLKVGICWRSMLLKSNRSRFYSPFDLWGPILQTPGVRFVNLQYGDCAEEIAHIEALHGVKIEVMEGLDLKNDIDGAAALSAAVDLVISAPTASATIAAGVGTETWFVTASRVWPQLGTDEFPWYRKTKVFYPDKSSGWAELLSQVAESLAAHRPA